MKNLFFQILSVIPKSCWNDCNITVISGKFHPEKQYGHFFFPQKKNPSDIPKWSFSDFETEPEAPFRNRIFFFSKFNLLV